MGQLKYHQLTILNGVLIALMLYFNSALSTVYGPYLSTFIFHLVALSLLLIINLKLKSRWERRITPLFLLPGFTSVITIMVNSICVAGLGVTVVGGIGLFGQLFMSSLIEQFGLFGMPKRPIDRRKIGGYLLISLGVLSMIYL